MSLSAVVSVRLRLVVVALLAAFAALAAASPSWAANPLRVSQVYGGGGNTGAQFTHDYIEIFNAGTSLILLDGMSVQYGSSTGNIGPNTSQITPLSGFIAPFQYVLIQEAAGAGNGVPIAPGKVALVNTTAGLNCGAAATPCLPAQLATIVDLVGYGSTANLFEGTGPTPTLSNTTAALRNGAGCIDTDDNAADFTAGVPLPRNRLSPINDCQADAAPQVAATTPAGGAVGVPVDSNVSITFSENVNASG
jgi:hypothetical protein